MSKLDPKAALMAELDKLPRSSKVILCVMGMIDELKAEGILEGGHLTLSEKGDQYVAALEEQGFEPTPEEIDWAVRNIMADARRQLEEQGESDEED